jgi:hypothetical protein
MMNVETQSTVDICKAALHGREWSCEDMVFHDGRAFVWQVSPRRGDQRIVAWAPTQGEAWAAAAGQARKIGPV